MTSSTPRQIAGHPAGIFVLATVEMWERFSYYGMRALLILYLVDRLDYADARAALVYGAYTSLVYGCSIIGGWVSDRFIGQWRSIVWGAILIMAGHLALAWQDSLTGGGEVTFYSALALIVTGTGLFKPNSTTLVGRLYPDDDNRRTTGFHFFYLGINAGSAGAALVCGALAATFGWGAGLGAAAIGMAIGLVVIYAGRDHLRDVAVTSPALRPIAFAIPILIAASAFALIRNPEITGYMLALCLIVGLTILGRFMAREATDSERRQLQSALILIGAAAVFWSLFEQAGSSLSLFAARAVDLTLGPISISAPQTQVFNPAFILMLTPLFALIWTALAKRGAEPGVAWKHAAGLLLVGLGFGALVIGIGFAGSDGKVSLGWLILAYLLHTLGELCLAPTAYQAMATLAPPKVAGLVMGLWLFSISIGNYVGARVATLVARPEGGVSASTELAVYDNVFSGVLMVAGLAAVTMALLVKHTEKWMRA